ncbi:MAG: hypothetical protein WCS99_21755 [Limisphaerales bacterium]
MEQQDDDKTITAEKMCKKTDAAVHWVLDPVGDKPFADGTVYPPQDFHGHNLRGKPRRQMHEPLWMEGAAEWERVTPEQFREVRWLVHRMTVEQCAAFLRVNPATVWRWENGSSPITFAAFVALRLLSDVRFVPHQVKEWDGWQIINAGVDVGVLYDSKKTGAMFSPSDLRASQWVKAERDSWKKKAEEAEARVAELETENTRLRQLFNTQGVTTELRQMQDKLAVMLDSIGTAEIFEYRPAAAGRNREKVA